MTINIKAPQKSWELSKDTYFNWDSAVTRPNVRPSNWSLSATSRNRPDPIACCRMVNGFRTVNTEKYGKDAIDYRLHIETERWVEYGNTDSEGNTFYNLRNGSNLSIWQPYHFALNKQYNFGDNKVFFLLRDELAYWLTEGQAARYLAGFDLTIKDTTNNINVNDGVTAGAPVLTPNPTLFTANKMGEWFI